MLQIEVEGYKTYMKGPEGYYDLSDLRQAEAFETPEGYDLTNLDHARAYLTEVHGFDLPEPRGAIDAITGNHITYRMQHVNRAGVHADGRPQNDAEHSFAAADTALEVVGRLRPDLNPGTVAIMLIRHDRLEALSGDTSIFDEEALKTKPYRETAARTILRHESMDNPTMLAIDEEYEAGISPEARFAHGWDGVEAVLLALNTQARLQRERADDFRQVVEKQLQKANADETTFEWSRIVMIELGRKWHEWGCMPFDGDPYEIINATANKIMTKGQLYEFPTEEEWTDDDEPDDRPGQLVRFPGRLAVVGQLEAARQIMEPATLEELGVPVLANRRPEEDIPPPTPPSPPAPTAVKLRAV